jgi:transcriptional regulator with PAS, ATPase and Fis domain
MTGGNWINEFTGAVTLCDLSGIVLYMNNKAAETFQKYGGKSLIGKSLLDCHPESARKKLLHLLKSGESNSYTIEKNGKKRLIHQAPLFKEGVRCGMVEFSLEIPFELPNYVRS